MKIKDNSKKSGKWVKQDHLFGKPTYKCSRCGGTFPGKGAVCPACSAKMKKTVSNPVWVDEMEFFD